MIIEPCGKDNWGKPVGSRAKREGDAIRGSLSHWHGTSTDFWGSARVVARLVITNVGYYDSEGIASLPHYRQGLTYKGY